MSSFEKKGKHAARLIVSWEVMYLWELYDHLIEAIPVDIRVDFVAVGAHITAVGTGDALGLAQTLVDERRPRLCEGSLIGTPLRELAALLKSWNFVEASLGLAALCAWYNAAAISDVKGRSLTQSAVPGQFRFLKRLVENCRVATTCEADYLTRWIKPAAQLTCLAETPSAGLYPLLASEYLIKEQDLLLLSGDAFITKRLPRLLELPALPVKTVLAGFGIPLAECLSEYGVDEIAAACVTDAGLCRQLVLEGATPDQVLAACVVIRQKAAA
jgi:uncharacterized protein (DUF4213/DUF364 family)